MPHVKPSPEVETILRRSTIEGNVLKLPPGQLERSLYEQVNKALVAAGGKWKRGKGHVFPGNPSEKLGLALESGTVVDEKKLYQFFPTPPDLAAEIVARAHVSGMWVLEPSAGAGALVRECMAQGATYVECWEINEEHADALCSWDNSSTHFDDFLDSPPDPRFDRVVMNPPFTKQQDLKHVAHAVKFLKPDGLLFAIMQGNRGPEDIEKLTGDGFSISMEPLPENAFKESGTNIRTALAIISRVPPLLPTPRRRVTVAVDEWAAL